MVSSVVYHERELLANNVSQLDKLVGLGMLVAASVVFLYYTVWTLLMVRKHFNASRQDETLTQQTVALRRLEPPPSEHLPTSSLGYPNPCYPHPPWLSCRRFIPERGHDPE